MLTFEAEKYENIVAFVLFVVVPVWEIVRLGAEALSAGGHRSRFEAVCGASAVRKPVRCAADQG